MDGKDAKVLQTVLLNLASSAGTSGAKIREIVEEAFLHLGDEHFLINCLVAIKQEAELMEQGAIECKARSEPDMERMEFQLKQMEEPAIDNRFRTPSPPESYEASDDDSYDSDRSTRYSIWNRY